MNAETRSLGHPETHFWLTRSVARVMGVNLSQAMTNGTLTARDYAALVSRCRTCTRVAECQNWLGQQRSEPPDPPRHCLNRDRLARIAQDQPI